MDFFFKHQTLNLNILIREKRFLIPDNKVALKIYIYLK